MNRDALIDALKLCRGALEGAAVRRVFSHYCFGMTDVYSYNDVVAVVVPFNSGIHAALRGDVLLGVLGTLGKEFQLEHIDDTVIISSNRSKTTLAALSSEEFMFQLPSEKWKVAIDVNDELFTGMTQCAQTVGDDSQHREFTCVTFVAQNDKLTIYSTDDMRLSCFKAPVTYQCKTNGLGWMLPSRSCQLFADLWRMVQDAENPEAESKSKLYISDTWAWLQTSKVTMYSHLEFGTPPNLQETIVALTPKKAKWLDIPEGLVAAVARANVLTANDVSASMRIAVHADQLDVELDESPLGYGTFQEQLTLSAPVETLELELGIVTLNQTIAEIEQVLFTPRCLGLRKGNFTCFVSPSNYGPVEEE